jgi:hypothetical protein
MQEESNSEPSTAAQIKSWFFIRVRKMTGAYFLRECSACLEVGVFHGLCDEDHSWKAESATVSDMR